MARNDYHFITKWHVPGLVQEIADVIGDADNLAKWWPSVYLDVHVMELGDERGIGRYIRLYTKGWLPYTLRWDFRVTHSDYPHSFTIEAYGDFTGRGIWTLVQNGDVVDITYDWRIRANKPLLRSLSFLMKPVFEANHHWAMQRGETSLRLELARRRATNDEERARIPAPPGPTRTSPLILIVGAALVLASIYGLWRSRK